MFGYGAVGSSKKKATGRYGQKGVGKVSTTLPPGKKTAVSAAGTGVYKAKRVQGSKRKSRMGGGAFKMAQGGEKGSGNSGMSRTSRGRQRL